MEQTNLQAVEIKKTWETPAIIEIEKSTILAGPGGGNDGNGVGAGAAGAPAAS